MKAIIDDQGRVEIPRSLRDRLHLTSGTLVDVEQSERGVQVTPVTIDADFQVGKSKLVREGSLLVLCGIEPLTVDEVNGVIERGRNGRVNR